MLIAIVAAWVGTTFWVALDARRRVWSRPAVPDDALRPRVRRRPWLWAVATLLAWPIVFPIYIYQRANVPLRPPF